MENIFQTLKAGDLARRHSLTYADIGSRGGFQADLYPLAFAVDAVGFEPDPVAFKSLENLPAGPWKSIRHLPYGISDTGGTRKLHVPKDPAGASLLEHDPALGRRFNMQHLFEIARTERIETRTMQTAVTDAGLGRVDYLKLDVEGAELAILQASPEIVDDLLAVKTEVSFLPPRIGQPLAADIDTFMCDHGFELMTIIDPAHWRRERGPVDPYIGTAAPPYSKGQLVHADFLYMRTAASVGGGVPKLIRLALLQMALGYFDHALSILEGPDTSGHIATEMNCSPMDIVVPASRAYGKRRFLRAFHDQTRGLVPFLRHFRNLFG